VAYPGLAPFARKCRIVAIMGGRMHIDWKIWLIAALMFAIAATGTIRLIVGI
jgi:hypothetical protein